MSVTPRPLGRSGLAIPPLVFGGNVFGWTIGRDEGFRVLDAFADGGATMIDTASSYADWVPGNKGGESETIIGEWLRRSGRRDEVLIASKTFIVPGVGGDDRPAPIRIPAAVDASLARLGVDQIDLYYVHRDDPARPVEEALEALDKVVRAGKVRALAASNFSDERLAEALDASAANGWARYEALQPRYNLLERGQYEGDLQRLCLDREVGVVTFYALASGYLTGKYRTPDDLTGARAAAARGHMAGKGPAMLAAMEEVAAETGATLAQIALAWVAAQPGVTAPIASATTPEQLAELLGAMTVTLAPDQLAKLDGAIE